MLKKIIASIVYFAFAFVYAFRPEITFAQGFSFAMGSFSVETFIMMIFIGVYIVGFWRFINKLFTN